MNNKKSPLYEICIEKNHTENYLGSYSSIQDIKWIEKKLNISRTQLKKIEQEIIDDGKIFHTEGELSGFRSVVVYDEQSGLFDWYSHIPNEITKIGFRSPK
tara:strand:- start:581 stop:883 length:303 start_codon:yes stop_codon:yes gene_type:complete